jgi:hypothetical protein
MDERSRTTEKNDSLETSADVHELETTRRGSKRPGYSGTTSTLAAAINDPIALVKTNIARNADARRWRDLMLHYQNRIGDVLMHEESVRVRVLALVNATLELDDSRTAWLLAVAASFCGSLIMTKKDTRKHSSMNAATRTC